TASAIKRNSFVDLAASSVTLAGISFPSFFLGIVLILLFAYVIPGHIFPPGGYTPVSQDLSDNLRRLVLPAITLAAGSLAVNLRQVRSCLLDVFGHDYMRTSRAKGLRERTVIARQALKNALIPVVTLIRIQVVAIIEGAFVLAWIFLAIFAPIVAPYDPIKVNVSESLIPPSRPHMLGTDDLGRDVLSRVIWGSRVSLSVGVISVTIGFVVGVSLGL